MSRILHAISRPRTPGGAHPLVRGSGSVAVSLCILLLFALAACSKRPIPLVLASTTSTEDSGLFDVLLPAFQKAYARYRVQLVAVGSGQALELGQRGDADVLLVHSPAAEQAFMQAGHGESRRAVMYNDFVLVGPAEDPAHVQGLEIVTALRTIAAAGAPFLSRGDDSGTHRKELSLWLRAGIEPGGSAWYTDVGQGMGETLAIAAERRAYTLSDRGTFLYLQQKTPLKVLVEGGDPLLNPYSVIVVRNSRNLAGARAFAEWITSRTGQAVIGSYGVQQFGRPLFVPDAKATSGD